MGEPARLRLLFDDRHVLSKCQRSSGLRRSWLLLHAGLLTVSDVASHIVESFKLHLSCPDGIVLCMDDFVLPPFESINIFKDKDVVRRKKSKVCSPMKLDATPAGDIDVVEVESCPKKEGMFEKNVSKKNKRSPSTDEETFPTLDDHGTTQNKVASKPIEDVFNMFPEALEDNGSRHNANAGSKKMKNLVDITNLSKWLASKTIFHEQYDEKNNGEKPEVATGSLESKRLVPSTRSPKEGDIVAYQLVELSTSWCPEISSDRVGRVASFDPNSMNAVMVPVPGHPL